MLGIFAVVVIGLVVGGTILLQPKDSTSSNTGTSTSQSSDDSSSNLDPNATFKDGTYSANGSYSSPGGNEEIAVTITISAGKVTDSSVTPKAASRESGEYQAEFVDGYNILVTNKELATLRLSRVSGSSLTPRGFNQALNDIRTQAKS